MNTTHGTNAPTVILAGGGTGGHLFPGVAVAERLVQRSPGARVLLAATEKEREAAHGVGCPLEMRRVESPRIPRNPLRLPLFALQMLASIWRSFGVLRTERPDVVIGLGGYGSVATVLAARMAGRPVLLLEQNAVPGLANRFLSRLGAVTASSFPGLEQRGLHGPVVHTGNPLRGGVLRLWPAHDRLGLRVGVPVLAVLGGSLGATGMNRRFLESLEGLTEAATRRTGRPDAFQVIHACGPRDDVEAIAGRYHDAGVRACVRPFFHDMGAVYGTADVVLCRAGGTTVAELAAVGLPAVFVPYPHHKDQQQRRNALELVERGAATLLEEVDMTPSAVIEHVAPLLTDPGVRARRAREARRLGRPDAADRVVDLIDRLARAPARRLTQKALEA